MEDKKESQIFGFSINKDGCIALKEAISLLPVKLRIKTYIYLDNLILDRKSENDSADVAIDISSIEMAIQHLSELPIKDSIQAIAVFQQLLKESEKFDNEKNSN